MIHKGNISKIKITPEDIVDCVIGGSPCQDLSVAGKRAGLKHEANGDNETTRSGLFIEQIRIMKEMRELDKASGRTGIHVRCRWGIWENVPGALSSNGGEDFRIVLEEFCKVADPDASVPRPANGKWNNSGCVVGDSYSVAWRILDARYHGVPQRRRRITLVADFAGQSAPQILFDEEGMYWNFEQSQEAWKRAADHAEQCPAGSGGEGLGDGTVRQVYLKFDPETSMLWNNIRRVEMRLADSEVEEGREEERKNLRYRLSEMYEKLNEKIQPLIKGKDLPSEFEVKCLNPWDAQSIRQYDPSGIWPSLTANENGGQFRAGVVQNAEAFGETGIGYWQEGVQTLRSEGENRPSRPSNCVVENVYPTTSRSLCKRYDSSPCIDRGQEIVVYSIDADSSNSMKSPNPHSGFYETDYAKCLDTSGGNPVCNGKGWKQGEAYTLNTIDRHAVAYDTTQITSPQNSSNPTVDGPCHGLAANQHKPLVVIFDARGNGDGATSCTITGDHCNRVTDYTPIAIQSKYCAINGDIAGTLDSSYYKGCGERSGIEREIVCAETVGSLCARDYKGVGTQYVEEGKCVVAVFDKQRSDEYGNAMVSSTLSARDYKDAGDLVVSHDRHYIVRRLTPLECSRLQGLQDDWCVVPPQESVTDEDIAFWKPFWDEWMQINGKQPKTENQIRKWLMSEVSESAQYQMYGNGIAAPQWFWVCGRVIETYGLHKPTMASLFDGTGSFPWIWNSILGGDYTVWSSEVNPEAVRVSKYRIG